MESDDSGINCPFCKTPMSEGYASLQGDILAVVYFSKKSMSWESGLLSALGKERETILDNISPQEHARLAYKCNSCNAVLIKGTASPTQADYAKAEDLEKEKEDLKDKVRMMQGP
jgi:hypothetical protein